MAQDFPVGVHNVAQCLVPRVIIRDEEEFVFILVIWFLPDLSGDVSRDSLNSPVTLIWEVGWVTPS